LVKRWGPSGATGTPRYERLNREVSSFQMQLDHLRGEHPEAWWLKSAETYVGKAAEARGLAAHATDENERDNQVGAGWYFLARAQGMTVFALEGNESALRNKVTGLRAEAVEKLSSWRKTAALDYLKDPPSAGDVHNALELLTGHFENQYFKISVARGLLRALTRTLVAVFALLFVFLLLQPLLWPDDLGITLRHALALALFGALGGCVSACFSLGGPWSTTRIPDVLSGVGITSMRPLLGGASALGAYVMLLGLGQIIGVDSKSSQLWPPLGPPALAIAFAAGFSERIVIKAVEGIASKQS
jgi:hypothetical protein